MNKGDIVKIKAIVFAHRAYDGNKHIKKLQRIEQKGLKGIVLGYSLLKTGTIKKGQYRDEPSQLIIEQSHRVMVVEPFEQYNSWLYKGKYKTNRYLEPVRCFEDDLELVEDNHNAPT